MNFRDDSGKVKTNVIIGTVFVAMLVAMVPAVMAITTTSARTMDAEGADSVDKPYVKAFAGGKAIHEPNAGNTNVFGPGGIFLFFNSTFACGDALTCGVETDATFKGVFKEAGE